MLGLKFRNLVSPRFLLATVLMIVIVLSGCAGVRNTAPNTMQRTEAYPSSEHERPLTPMPSPDSRRTQSLEHDREQPRDRAARETEHERASGADSQPVDHAIETFLAKVTMGQDTSATKDPSLERTTEPPASRGMTPDSSGVAQSGNTGGGTSVEEQNNEEVRQDNQDDEPSSGADRTLTAQSVSPEKNSDGNTLSAANSGSMAEPDPEESSTRLTDADRYDAPEDPGVPPPGDEGSTRGVRSETAATRQYYTPTAVERRSDNPERRPSIVKKGNRYAGAPSGSNPQEPDGEPSSTTPDPERVSEQSPGEQQATYRYRTRLGVGILLLGILLGVILVEGLLRWKAVWAVLGESSDEDSGESEGERVCREVPLDAIVGNPYHPRSQVDEEKLDNLAASIEEHGVITPVQVQTTSGDGSYQLIVGQRRVRACRKLGRETIPAIIRDLDPEELREISFVENLQGESLNPVELARGYERLRREFRHERPEELGRRIGKSPEEIQRYDWILDLTKMAQEALSRGVIDVGIARNLLDVSPEEQKDFIRYVSQNNPDPGEITERLAALKVSEDDESTGATEEELEAEVDLPPSPTGVEDVPSKAPPGELSDSDDVDRRTAAPP